MMYLQILVTIFIVFILLKLFLQKQKNKISLLSFLVWSLLWLMVLIVFWLPDSTTYLASWLGIGRGADLVVYVSVLVIFYMIFRVFVRLHKIEDEMTKIVRSDAIKNVKEE